MSHLFFILRTCCYFCLFSFSLIATVMSEEKASKYQPEISDASAEGKQAIQGFQIPKFLEPSLVAAEPDLANPVAFCIDAQGRFYIAETFRQQKGVEDNRSHMDWLHDDLAAQTVKDRIAFFKKHLGDRVADYSQEQDRIRLLEDTDADGSTDRSTIYADGFNAIEDGTGAGILSFNGDVYYTCIPKLYRLRDTNQDGRADVRETLHDGYGVRVAFRGHDMHGLTLGPDGRIYFSIGDRGYNVLTQEGVRLKRPDTGAVFRCEPDGSHLEVFAYGLRNPQELAFDNFGNLFTGDNNSDSGDQARWVYVVQDGDTGWRMYFQYLSDRGPWNRERMWYPHRADPQTTQKQPAYIIPPVANLGDGPSGLTFYPGVGLPERYQDHFFMADFRGSSPNSGIRSFSVVPKGASFELTDSHQFLWSVLATDVDFGYDGSLYLTDWVNGWNGPGKGRLYRFSSGEDTAIRSEVQSLFASGFRELEDESLVSYLSHADRRVRQASQFELVNRIQSEKCSVTLLKQTVASGQPRMSRIHGLWGIGQLLRNPSVLSKDVPLSLFQEISELSSDEDEEIRAQLARVLGDFNEAGCLDILRDLIRDDPSPRVRHLAALSFGRIYHNGDLGGDTASADIDLMFSILSQVGDQDPVLRHSAVMGLVGIGKINPQWLVGSISEAGDAERLGILLALRRLDDPRIALFLKDPNPSLILSAARAIHDEPMEELNSELAALVANRELRTIDPLMRRVIHAAFRDGKREYAAEVASIAADTSVSDPVRVLAAELLQEWNTPGPLDRVIGSWRPLDREPTTGLGQEIESCLPGLLSSNEKLRTLGIQLASTYEIRDVNPLLWSLFEDEAETNNNRVSALRALSALQADELPRGVERALESAIPELRAVGRSLLLARNPAAAFPELEQAIDGGTPLEKQSAIADLSPLKIPEANHILKRLAEHLVDGQLATEIQLDVLLAAKQRKSPAFQQLVKTYEEQLSQTGDPFRKYQVALKGGDRQRGYDIFFGRSDASCRRCHKVNGSGGEVGPDLSKIGFEKQRDYLLESIVNPNAKIAKGFETAIIVTDRGKVITGIVKEETDQSVTVMLNDGTLVRVDKDEIEDRAPGRSGMPDDLVKQLSLSDIRDLVEYLSSLRKAGSAEGHLE
ncbi:MAG: HEAT repeat domain-containing protein [Planctomycetaceae bacterium]|nr:HEAT repeat domain-containing protein [Planctomycetaceae bacterium]